MNQLSQLKLNNKIINLILVLLHKPTIQLEQEVNKTYRVLLSMIHSLQTKSQNRILIQVKEFNNQSSKTSRKHHSSPTPCSCNKTAFKPHNSNTCNSSNYSSSRHSNNSSIRRRWHSNRIHKCNTAQDSKVSSNSHQWIKDNSAQPCHNMVDNNNSNKCLVKIKICKVVISSILEIHSSNNNRCSKISKNQKVPHSTFFEQLNDK